MVPEQPSLWEDLVRAIVGFPKYIFGWTVGLVIAVLTDLHITALAVTAALAGVYGTSVLLGVLVFFAIYSLSRVANLTANAIGFGAREIAGSTFNAGQAVANAQGGNTITVTTQEDTFDG